MKSRILVIGGTSGIGFETCQYLSENGYEVFSAGRRTIDDSVVGINFLNADVTNEDSIKSLFESFNGPLNGLVYSSGISHKKTHISEFCKDSFQDLMAVNVTGLLLVLKYAFPLLKESCGRVVVLNSVASRSFSLLSGVEYTASKAALSGVVKQLSQEWASDKVLINSVFPSMTDTPMLKKVLSAEKRKEIVESIPLHSILSPKEVARAIEFLISEKNTYMTGSGIDLNGGQFING